MARTSSYQPYLTAIRRLHRKGLTDALIAETLWDLSPAAIAQLELGKWTRQRIEHHREPGSGDLGWTRGMVQYYRLRMRLPSNRLNPGKLLQLQREARWRSIQTQAHWGHLLARGILLRPREVQILSLLRERGPQTLKTIKQALGLRTKVLHSHGSYMPSRLRRLGLIAWHCWHGIEDGARVMFRLVCDPYPVVSETGCA